MLEILGTREIFDGLDLLRLLFRLALDLGFVFVLVHLVRRGRDTSQEYIFAFYLLNFITFAICVLLRRVPVDLGFALGLFAIFGILRYRTEPIAIRDLTYLFVVIGIAILTALTDSNVSLTEVIVINALIIGLSALLELTGASRHQRSRPARYDNLALLAPERREELIRDIRERTGLAVQAVEIVRLDLMRDSADLTIIYDDRGGGTS